MMIKVLVNFWYHYILIAIAAARILDCKKQFHSGFQSSTSGPVPSCVRAMQKMVVVRTRTMPKELETRTTVTTPKLIQVYVSFRQALPTLT